MRNNKFNEMKNKIKLSTNKHKKLYTSPMKRDKSPKLLVEKPTKEVKEGAKKCAHFKAKNRKRRHVAIVIFLPHENSTLKLIKRTHKHEHGNIKIYIIIKKTAFGKIMWEIFSFLYFEFSFSCWYSA